jgi:hypothetical protein
MKFVVGDKVVCINAESLSCLMVGERYEVVQIHGEGSYMALTVRTKNGLYDCMADRFKRDRRKVIKDLLKKL